MDNDKFCYWPDDAEGSWFVTGCGKSTRLELRDYFQDPCPFCGKAVGMMIMDLPDFMEPEFDAAMPLIVEKHVKA